MFLQLENIDDLSGKAGEGWEAMKRMLNSCWHDNAHHRPYFSSIFILLDKLKEEHAAKLPAMRDVGALAPKTSVEEKPLLTSSSGSSNQ